MISFNIANNIYSYENDNVTKIFFDLNNLTNNLSRVRMQPADTDACIHNIFVEYLNEYDVIQSSDAPEEEKIEFAIIMALLVKFLISKSRPVKILEIGFINSSLGYFLTKMARQFNTENKVFCVSNYLYDEAWIELIYRLEEAQENISVITASTGCEYLSENYFDFVIINGSEFMESPDITLQNAIRCCRTGGTLICSAKKQYFLQSYFEAYINGYENYPYDDINTILEKKINASDKSSVVSLSTSSKLEAWMQKIMDNCNCILNLMCSGNEISHDMLHSIIDVVDECETLSLEIVKYTDCHSLKNNLILLKEHILNFLYTTDSHYKSDLIEKINDVLFVILATKLD